MSDGFDIIHSSQNKYWNIIQTSESVPVSGWSNTFKGLQAIALLVTEKVAMRLTQRQKSCRDLGEDSPQFIRGRGNVSKLRIAGAIAHPAVVSE